MNVIEEVHQRLPYQFRKPALLEEALTHRSHVQEKSSPADKQNERLEF